MISTQWFCKMRGMADKVRPHQGESTRRGGVPQLPPRYPVGVELAWSSPRMRRACKRPRARTSTLSIGGGESAATETGLQADAGNASHRDPTPPFYPQGLDAVRSGETKIVPERFEKVYFNWLDNINDWSRRASPTLDIYSP